jgi:hypothetical protein
MNVMKCTQYECECGLCYSGFKFLAVLVIHISVKKISIQPNLRWLGSDPHRLARVIYEGQLDHHTRVIFDSPAPAVID